MRIEQKPDEFYPNFGIRLQRKLPLLLPSQWQLKTDIEIGGKNCNYTDER